MKKTAGILFGSQFGASAASAKAYLLSKRYKILLYRQFTIFSSIPNLPRAPGKLDLFVWYSHGGWDGPVVFDLSGTVPLQASPSEPKEWTQLKAYFNSQMNPMGTYIAHSCHSAGSDWREKRAEIVPKKDVWVRDIAKDMNLYTFGQSGKSGAANISSVKMMLDFVFTGKKHGMPFHAFMPGTGKEIIGMKAFPKL